jgi:hypothetical protein
MIIFVIKKITMVVFDLKGIKNINRIINTLIIKGIIQLLIAKIIECLKKFLIARKKYIQIDLNLSKTLDIRIVRTSSKLTK